MILFETISAPINNMSSRSIMNKHNHHRGPLSHKQIVAASKRDNMNLPQIAREQKLKTISKLRKARQPAKHRNVIEGDIADCSCRYGVCKWCFDSWDTSPVYDDYDVPYPRGTMHSTRQQSQATNALTDEKQHIYANSYNIRYRRGH